MINNIRLTRFHYEELAHKLDILITEEELLCDYNFTAEAAEALKKKFDDAFSNKRAWNYVSLNEDEWEVIAGEAENALAIAEDNADSDDEWAKARDKLQDLIARLENASARSPR